MNGGPDDEQPLLIRYSEGPQPLIVNLHLDVSEATLIVPAILRPDLRRSVIARQWASGLGLSEGTGLLAQIATANDDSAVLWGPCELITPSVSADLDPELGDDDLGAIFLGQDYLQSVILNLLGPLGMIVLLRRTDG